MKKEYSLKISWLPAMICMLGVLLLHPARGSAQLLPGFPKPKVYFSFDESTLDSANNSKYYKSVYNSTIVAKANDGKIGNTSDRFGGNNALVLSTIINTYHYSVSPGKLFGAVAPGAMPPANMTISCWVRIDIDNDYPKELPRFIFGAGKNFALLYKGRDIYLRRYVSFMNKSGYYDYKFWAPAQFNFAGWYQVMLELGTGADDAQYVKLFVGKPHTIVYDRTGPRIAGNEYAPVAFNFGGAYAFMNWDNIFDETDWYLGNGLATVGSNNTQTWSVPVIDDFAVWINQELDDNKKRQLFECQKYVSGYNDACWLQPAASARTAVAAAPHTDSLQQLKFPATNKLQAFTRNRNSLQVNLTLAQAQRVAIELYDMNGRLIVQKAGIVGFQGLNTQTLPVGTLASGPYVVKVTGVALNLVQKVLVP